MLVLSEYVKTSLSLSLENIKLISTIIVVFMDQFSLWDNLWPFKSGLIT